MIHLDLLFQFLLNLFPQEEEIRDWIYSNQNKLRWFEYSYVTVEEGHRVLVYAIFGAVTFAEILEEVYD